MVTDKSLARLAELSGDGVLLVLTRRRAAALGLGPAPSAPGGSVTLAIPKDTGAALLHEMADPGAAVVGLGLAAPLGARAADAAVELMKLARLLPAAVVAPMGALEASELVRDEGLFDLDVAEIFAYQAAQSHSLRPVSEAHVALTGAENTRIIAFRPSDGGIEHLAILIGEPDPANRPF